MLTSEDEDSSHPLPSNDVMSENEDGSKNGEELTRRCNEGKRQRPKLAHCHEDEILEGKKTHFIS